MASKMKQDKDTGEGKDIGAGIYWGSFEGAANMKWLIGASRQEYDTQRQITIGTKTYNPRASFETISIRGAGETEIELFGSNKKFTVNPVLGVQGAYIANNEVKEEEGEEANLIVSAGQYARLSATIGLRFRGENKDTRWSAYIYSGYIVIGAPDYAYDIEFKEAQKFGEMKIKAGDEGQAFGGLNVGMEKVIGSNATIFISGDIKIDPNNDENKISGYSVTGGIKLQIGKTPYKATEPEPKPELKPSFVPIIQKEPEEEEEAEEEEAEEKEMPNSNFSSLDGLDEETLIALLAELEKEQTAKPEEKEMLVQAQERRKNLIQSFRLSAATFKTNSSQLSNQSIQDIKKIAENLKSYDYKMITVEGHTDSSGNEAKNKILSRSRARTVYNELLKQGIPRTKLTYTGFGSLLPVSSNKTQLGRQQNRRVEIFVE
jgi:outer membrane protein OmpA-like peptidoglycan-associated protein